MKGLAHVQNIVLGETGNADSSIIWQINRVGVLRFLDHIVGQSSEGEHSDLGCDMAPVVLISKLLHQLHELSTVVLESLRHLDNLCMPLFLQLLVSKDDVNYSGSMDRWV